MLSHFILVCLHLVLINEVEVGVPIMHSIVLLLGERKFDVVLLLR
jgi:hypothetical protein